MQQNAQPAVRNGLLKENHAALAPSLGYRLAHDYFYAAPVIG
jgi:hypothetical protein